MKKIFSDFYLQFTHKIMERLPRFVIVGLLSTVLYGVLGILFLHLLKWSLWSSHIGAYATLIPVSYWAQRHWTFQYKGAHSSAFPRFLVNILIGFAIGSGLIAIVIQQGASATIGILTNMIVVPVISFILMQIWVFSSKDNLK